MGKTGKWAGKKSFCAVCIAVCLAVSGCGGREPEKELIVLEQDREEPVYELAIVSMGDVEKTLKLKCTYTQAKDEDLSFAISGSRIFRVYVKEGEHVTRGQLLAELSGGNREEEIRRLEYQIARNKLLLEHTRINEDYEISTLWLHFLYRTEQTQAEKKSLEEAVEDVQTKYRYIREDYEDAIYLDEMQLAQFQEELAQSRLYAGMDGTVSWVKEGLEGATSARGEKIMTVIDSSKCFFTVEQTEYAEYFEEGVEVDMSIISGTGAGQYKLVPYKMDRWEEQLMFSLSEGSSDSVLEVGSTGTMTVIAEQSKQVLNIPLKALHKADGKCYVYVVGEDNLREIKWIEAGLYGDDCVEVLAGLSEGEKVIIK